MKQTVLVTGGAGYIGSHACKALREAGFLPVTFDNMSSGNAFAVRYGPLEIGDILDLPRLREVFDRYRPVGVLHFAALSIVGQSILEPERYDTVNVAGTRNVLEAARLGCRPPVVLSSTCAVYGEPERLPLSESHPTNPINPYGATKRDAERVLEEYRTLHGVNGMVLRYFNAAGADADGEIGECRAHETHLIPLLVDVALGIRRSLSIFGTDYATPDGTAVRDYVHVTDLAAYHVEALRLLIAGGSSGPLNLGTGRGFSVKQLVTAVETLVGRQIATCIQPRRPGDAPALYADTTMCQKILGRPRHSSVDHIVRTALVWARRGYRPTPLPGLARSVRAELDRSNYFSCTDLG